MSRLVVACMVLGLCGCEKESAPEFQMFPVTGDMPANNAGMGDGDMGLAGDGDGSTPGDGDGNVPGPAGPPGAMAPEVQIAQGTVRGFMSEGVRAFTGIPFGVTTGGDNRWAAPKPAPAFTGVHEASEYMPPCAQFNATGAAFDMTSAEDCLGINVWAPATDVTGLPVMVWIYGGAYQFGSGGSPYNGESLVKAGNVIVVSFNYRLAATGFLAHPAITAEATAAGSPPANFGLQDQQLALRWVQDNIAAFGGDAANVTVFGESAGANSICMHMASPSSQGLFKRAIVESGLCLKPMLTLADAEAKGSHYAELMGCTDADPAAVLACLRQIPVEMALAGPEGAPERIPGGLFYQDATMQLGFQPIVDGVLIPEQPGTAFAAGNFGSVEAVLHGANTDEGALFHVPPLGGMQPMDDAQYMAALANRFGARAADVAAQYPAANYPSFADALSAVTGDAIFRCPAIRMAALLRDAGKTNYLYRFDMSLETSFMGLSGRAFHSAEIPFVFGHMYTLGSVPAESQTVSQAMQGYWTRFATGGDPNGAGATMWPAHDAAGGHLDLTMPIAAGADWGADGCGFWDDVDVVPF